MSLDESLPSTRFASAAWSAVSSEWTTPHIMLLILVTLFAIAVPTRLQSAVASAPKGKDERVHTVAEVPYWLPIIGHIPNMMWNATSFMRSLRDRYVDGAFTLNFGGTVHTIVYHPALVTALLNAKDSHASHEEVGATIGERIFGFPLSTERDKFDAANGEIRAAYHHMLSDAGLNEMVERTARATKDTISNLVSFSRSFVDQSYWERVANAEVVIDKSGQEVVAANMTDLIRDYCAYQSNASIIGSDFLNNFPEILADLWLVDRAFLYLGAGLPRWLPIPIVTKAHIARRNLINAFAELEEAMDKHAAGQDPGSKWPSIDDVGPVVKERVGVYRKHGLSMRARASFDFGLVWATNANSNMLVFWMLNRIYADKELLAEIRAEFAPYVQAVQPEQQFAVPEPPFLRTFDVKGLCSECPLLKSCYIECLRLDAGTWSFKSVKQDFELNPRDKSSKTFAIRKGQYIHAAHDLHNTNPSYFENPTDWKAHRHVRIDEKGHKMADLGNIRPYGGGSSMCKGRFFAYKECMMFTAAILAMWDMESVGGGKWKIPKSRKATGVFGTSDPTRVWLRRRKLPVVSI